jgi:hypothetical protein
MYLFRLIYFFSFFIFCIIIFSLILRENYKIAATIVFNVILIRVTIFIAKWCVDNGF